MNSRLAATRIMCVNCDIVVNNLRRYRALDQDTKVCTVLCNWVYPQILTEDDCVCESCWERSKVAVTGNMFIKNEPDSQPRHACILCGCSIERKQSDIVLRNNPTELVQSMINIIQMRREPHRLTTSDRVCHACWLRIKREALRNNSIDNKRVLDDMPENGNASENIQNGNPSENIQYGEIPPVDDIRKQNIIISDYRRAANTANHCIFSSCTNDGKLHSISDKLRAIILSNHKIYIPKLARICTYHITTNSWENLYNSENSFNTFTAKQIEHIFSFVNAFNTSLDFNNIQEMEERIFEYWVGMSKNSFNTLLTEHPQIAAIKGGTLGLVSLLIKKRTGDSGVRIATLMQKPRRTLEILMNRVKNVLEGNLSRGDG